MSNAPEGRSRRLALLVGLCAVLAGAACGPTIHPRPPDRFPGDAWRNAAQPLQIGETQLDTLNVAAGDHTDWKSIQTDRRGTMLIQLRVFRHESGSNSSSSSSGHLQILNPSKVVVLRQELAPEQGAFEIELPVVHPGVWLLGISLRSGEVSYELKAVWHR
ncbi:MAG: hypothetical protein FJ125_02330 [Deltaproteobacteria bacterium]|nr:hypothetical protein [Deltaproteobacteria bacterium]